MVINCRFAYNVGTSFVGGELSAYQGGLCSVMLLIALFLKVCNYREKECNICKILSLQICKFRVDVCTMVNVLHVGAICFSTDCTSQVSPFFN